MIEFSFCSSDNKFIHKWLWIWIFYAVTWSIIIFSSFFYRCRIILGIFYPFMNFNITFALLVDTKTIQDKNLWTMLVYVTLNRLNICKMFATILQKALSFQVSRYDWQILDYFWISRNPGYRLIVKWFFKSPIPSRNFKGPRKFF